MNNGVSLITDKFEMADIGERDVEKMVVGIPKVPKVPVYPSSR